MPCIINPNYNSIYISGKQSGRQLCNVADLKVSISQKNVGAKKRSKSEVSAKRLYLAGVSG